MDALTGRDRPYNDNLGAREGRYLAGRASSLSALIVAEVRDATSAMVQARRRLEAVRAEVRAADELATLEERRFDLGDSTLLIVNLRETAAAESHIKEVDALVDYHKAEANYRAATAWGDAGNRSAPARR